MKSTLIKAAIEAGKILKENFGGKFEISSKDVVSNLVTAIDKLSEEKIISVIQNDFPEHSILTEESGAFTQDSEFKWIIDPIDGTVNYAHSIPLTCVSIAVEKNAEVILGVVYNPISEEFFFAEKNCGAFLNNQRILVSKTLDINKGLVVTGFPYDSNKFKPNPVIVFEKFIRRSIPVRRLGSAALDLCWTACGRFEGFWEYNLNAWDVAAGCLILTEAGGMLSDFKGNNYSIYGKEILATNKLVHNQMLEIISGE